MIPRTMKSVREFRTAPVSCRHAIGPAPPSQGSCATRNRAAHRSHSADAAAPDALHPFVSPLARGRGGLQIIRIETDDQREHEHIDQQRQRSPDQ